MAKVTTNRKVKIEGQEQPVERKLEWEFDFGSDLDDAAKKHGKESVFKDYVKGATLELHALVGNCFSNGLSDAEIHEKLKNHKLGTAAPRVKQDPIAALLAKAKNASPEEKKAMLAQIKAALA